MIHKTRAHRDLLSVNHILSQVTSKMINNTYSKDDRHFLLVYR